MEDSNRNVLFGDSTVVLIVILSIFTMITAFLLIWDHLAQVREYHRHYQLSTHDVDADQPQRTESDESILQIIKLHPTSRS